MSKAIHVCPSCKVTTTVVVPDNRPPKYYTFFCDGCAAFLIRLEDGAVAELRMGSHPPTKMVPDEKGETQCSTS